MSEPEGKLRAGADERAARPEPKTYAPAPEASTNKKPVAAQAAKKTAAKKPDAVAKKPAADNAAKAVGKQIGRMGKMFSSFKDEFDKASK